MKIIRWAYKITLKSLTGYTSLWLRDFPYYDQRKKTQDTNRNTISWFFVWQFMVHSMISKSGQSGVVRINKNAWIGLENGNLGL